MPKKPILSQRVLEQHSLNRFEREQRTRRMALIGSIGVGVVVLLLIAAAALQVLVYEPNRAVASVNGENITVKQTQLRMHLELTNLTYNYSQLAQQVQQLQTANDPTTGFIVQYYQQQLQQLTSRITAAQIASNSLDALINDALIRQEAKRRGLTVSTDDIQQEQEKSIGYYRVTLTPFPTYTPVTPLPTDVPQPTSNAITATQPITPQVTETPEPSATPRLQPTSITQAELQQGKERGVKFYDDLGYPAGEFDHAYESNLLTKKVQDAIASEVPTQTLQFQFDYVRFNTVETATEYAQAFASGKIDFETMITMANTITQPLPIGLGGHRDWTTQDNVTSLFGAEVLTALLRTPNNQVTGVITSELTGGFYLLLPHENGVRPLAEADLSQAQQKAFTDWLAKIKSDAAVVQRLLDPITIMPKDVKANIDSFQQQTGGSQDVPGTSP